MDNFKQWLILIVLCINTGGIFAVAEHLSATRAYVENTRETVQVNYWRLKKLEMQIGGND